jgi:hypothetical protein
MDANLEKSMCRRACVGGSPFSGTDGLDAATNESGRRDREVDAGAPTVALLL